MKTQQLEVPKEEQLLKIRDEVRLIADAVTRSTNLLMSNYSSDAEKYAMNKVCKNSSVLSRLLRLC